MVKLQHIKDLFMRRPPPSLDRLKTNDMLVEMLSLWKHPQVRQSQLAWQSFGISISHF